MSRQRLARWCNGPLFGVSHLGAVDVVVAVVLSAFGVASVTGLTDAKNHGGVVASLAVLLITAPVVLARRYPVPVAAALAVGAQINWAVSDKLVRCGVALPAVFFTAFLIGSRCPQRRASLLGLRLLVANLVGQSFSDPQLNGPAVLVLMVPITLGFFAAGRLVQGRNAAVARLRLRTAELRANREENARLAVAADQARLSGDLDQYLHDRVEEIAAAAAAGRATLDSEPALAKEAFAVIQDTGRATLNHMRGVVASLRDEAPTAPQPVLAQLDRLLRQAAPADARLEVTGDARLLPPGVELSGYRIVEHLLLALENDASARVDVVVGFGPDALELRVTGPTGRGSTVRAALAAARERAALHGGTLSSETRGDRLETVVFLPLAVGRA